MRPRPPARGFTLVELLVGVVVSLFVIAGAVALLQAQKRSFQGSSADRAMQETARMALDAVSRDLRMAGYGVEPAMVFDLGQMTNVPMDRAPQVAGKTVTFGGDSAGTTGFACGTPAACRDAVDGPDELVFQYRNPYFNHQLLSVPSSNSLTIAGPLGQPIRAGQVLQVVCYTGSMSWVYVRVSQEVAATASATATVSLESGTDLDYPHQNVGLSDSCFSSTQSRVFEVERVRYFVQSYDATGGVVAWNTPGSRPYLLVDRGLRDTGGNELLDVVAPDVEDLQVAYVFPLAATGNQVAGATVGTRLDDSDKGIDFTPTDGQIPTFASARLSTARTSHYPSNIRAVRVSAVVRQPSPDAGRGDAFIPAAGNRAGIAAGDTAYRRSVFETSVALPNLEARAAFFPTVEPTSSTLNVGGG